MSKQTGPGAERSADE